MRNRLIYYFLFIAVLTSGLSSCVDDYFRSDLKEDYDGEEMTVQISLKVAPMNPGDPSTRTENTIVNPDEMRIHDFWVIQYNESGTRIAFPRYYKVNTDGTISEDLAGTTVPVDTLDYSKDASETITKDNIKIIVPREGQGDFICVVIANTNDPSMFNKDNRGQFSTLNDLRQYNTAAHNHETIFNPKKGKYLLMSGWTTISRDPATHNLNVDLIRNVCKVHINLNEDFPKKRLFYKYYQWRDVPLGKVFPHGNVVYHQPVSRDWRQHEGNGARDSLINGGIDFYLPSNVWLLDGPLTDKKDTKSGETSTPHVDEDPTHFSIVCREILWFKGNPTPDANGDYSEDDLKLSDEQYEFNIFPSRSVDKQFEFKLNHYYNIDVKISGLPKAGDPFCKVVEYKRLGDANSYMIKRDSKDTYALPLGRINTFWEHYDPGNERGNILSEDTEWVAEVIWQDTPLRIIDFASYKEFEAAKDLSSLNGKGPTALAFRPTGTGEGNVVVGVRKKVEGWETIPREEREYLWSWHLWITDYEPDAALAQLTVSPEFGYDMNRFGYYVPGGAVHHYLSMIGESERPLFLMDRDLGAMAAKISLDADYQPLNMDEIFQTFGLFYQYGRKDPFPNDYDHSVTVYDIYGNKIEKFNADKRPLINSIADSGTIADGVLHPYIFYMRYDDDDVHVRTWFDRDNENSFYDVEYWENPEWNELTEISDGMGGILGKSFFDPCPPGWAMIHSLEILNCWDEGGGPGTMGLISVRGTTNEKHLGKIFYMWPDSEEYSWWPASGQRPPAYTFSSNMNYDITYFWTFNGQSVQNSAGAFAGDKVISRASGASTRCYRIEKVQ